jgi:hypothetical protein
MFDSFNDAPRTWKWAVPAAVFILLIPVMGWMLDTQSSSGQYLVVLPCGFGGLCLVIAMVNLWKLITAHNEEMFAEHQSALSVTPLVLLSNNMKQMHPEAVKVLNRFGVRTSWQVRVDANRGSRDWLLTDTNAHFGFIEFVLSRSGKALYPKNRFGEGSMKWDPDGLVTDREQYEDLEKWMFSRLMVTRSHGEYKPAEFLPPWTPALILETMGLTGVQDLYQPVDDREVKQLPEGKETVVIQKAIPQKKDEARALTDEELEAIQNEMVRNASQYSS